MMNENLELGYAMDPSAIYGPTSGSHLNGDREEAETQVVSDAPLDGPVGPDTANEGASNRLTPRGFFSSPVGQLLVLLPLAYVAFHKAFGNG